MSTPVKKQASGKANDKSNDISDDTRFLYLMWVSAGFPRPDMKWIGEQLNLNKGTADMRLFRLRKKLEAAGLPTAKDGPASAGNDNQDAAAPVTPPRGRKSAAATPKKTPSGKGRKRKASEEAAEDKSEPAGKKVKTEEDGFEDVFGESVVDDGFGSFEF